MKNPIKANTHCMQNYDNLFIQPPAVCDFHPKPLFPGALGRTVEGIQFIIVPISKLNIAEWIHSHGCKVMIDNLGDQIVSMPGFKVSTHLKKVFSKATKTPWHEQTGNLRFAQKQLGHARLVLG